MEEGGEYNNGHLSLTLTPKTTRQEMTSTVPLSPRRNTTSLKIQAFWGLKENSNF